jgi:AcrR family transcriptional regulator
MARVGDHATRRLEVLDATWRVIAREGIDGASVREIAHELGASTGVLSHYFRNKDEILRAALQLAHTRTTERARERAATADGAVALVMALAESLALDRERLLEAQVQVAFWGRAMANKALNDLQHPVFDGWDAFVRSLVQAVADRGELKAKADVDSLTVTLVAVVDGACLEAALFPERMTPERQLTALLTPLLAALTSDAARSVRETAARLLAASAL